jgi:hypothetical protein
MAELKTRPNDASVAGFLAAIDDPRKRADARKVAAMMRRATGKSCLYIKRLSDVDEAVLQKLIDESVKHMRKKYDTK